MLCWRYSSIYIVVTFQLKRNMILLQWWIVQHATFIKTDAFVVVINATILRHFVVLILKKRIIGVHLLLLTIYTPFIFSFIGIELFYQLQKSDDNFCNRRK